MSDKSIIEWTDATWNPITGCSVVSAGCKHCYAMKLAGGRLQHHPSRAGLTIDAKAGPVWTGEVRLNGEWLDQPIRWARQRMVFVCAHSDLFHESVPDEWIDAIFGVMWACLYGRNEQDGHIFQVLTKRAERMRNYFKTDRREAWARAAVNYGGGIDPDGLWDQVAGFDGPHPRIWLGVSVENQEAADERIPMLLDTPAAVRWISAEPLLGPVDLTSVANPLGVAEGQRYINALGGFAWECSGSEYVDTCNIGASIDWVVAGGESGPCARPMHPAWARDLRDQCAVAGTPFMFKQWGEYSGADGITAKARDWKMVDDHGRTLQEAGSTANMGPVIHMAKIGKKAAGRLLDGIEHNGFPIISK